MKVKVSEASGPTLDWMVATADNRMPSLHEYSKGGGKWFVMMQTGVYRTVCAFSESWAQGGPIIDREGIGFYKANATKWWAHPYGGEYNCEGPTSLVAAMRCFVAAKLGEEVEVPDSLV